MQYPVECWAGCGKEFVAIVPDRSDPQLTEGVHVVCRHCGEPYTFTVDGDGEPSLDSRDSNALGENISGPQADDSTHY